jgi:hypothetical protein
MIEKNPRNPRLDGMKYFKSDEVFSYVMASPKYIIFSFKIQISPHLSIFSWAIESSKV